MPRDLPAPPTIDCLPLPLFVGADLGVVRAAFRDAAPIALGQPWLDAPDPDFAPATVRTGWRDRTLFVFAELSDADIFTRAARHNDRCWELGDTLELFLQPAAGQPYVEFHITPTNLRLQLRFAIPPPPEPDPQGDPFEAALIRTDMFQSRTWVNETAGEWCVLAEVPAGSVGDASAQLEGSRWRFSFSRYDDTRGRAEPVLSSSSPHPEPRFHRPHEWGVLHFRG